MLVGVIFPQCRNYEIDLNHHGAYMGQEKIEKDCGRGWPIVRASSLQLSDHEAIYQMLSGMNHGLSSV
jgi:hypothetical protein